MMPKVPELSLTIKGWPCRYSIVGTVARDLRSAGYLELAEEYQHRGLRARSFDEVIGVSREYVTIQRKECQE